MFVGHYGVGFAARRADSSIPLWVLFLAVQLLDVLWAPCILLGIEKVRIVPGITATVALHGAVRGTVDVDLVIRLREAVFRRTERALNELGLLSRLPVTASEVFRFREEYLRNRNLRAWTFVNPSRPSEIVDVILSEDLARMDVEKFTIQNQVVRVALL